MSCAVPDIVHLAQHEDGGGNVRSAPGGASWMMHRLTPLSVLAAARRSRPPDVVIWYGVVERILAMGGTRIVYDRAAVTRVATPHRHMPLHRARPAARYAVSEIIACTALLLAGCTPPHVDPGAAISQPAAVVEAELRHDTQALLDAVAPGDVQVWDELLDPNAIQVDENDVVRDKGQILAGLTPLGPGLIGTLAVDDFRMVLHGTVAVVTHEDAESLDYHGQMIRSRFRNTDTWVRADGRWRLLASQVLAVLQDPPAVHLGRATLCGYAGRYAMTNDIAVTLQCAGDSLVVKQDGRPDRVFLAEVRDVFFEPGRPRTRRIFQRDGRGAITGFVDRREARDVAWRRLAQ